MVAGAKFRGALKPKLRSSLLLLSKLRLRWIWGTFESGFEGNQGFRWQDHLVHWWDLDGLYTVYRAFHAWHDNAWMILSTSSQFIVLICIIWVLCFFCSMSPCYQLPLGRGNPHYCGCRCKWWRLLPV
jgi:hypothetical protein